MKLVPVGRQFALVDDNDFTEVSKRIWHLVRKRSKRSGFYARTTKNLSKGWPAIYMHRLILRAEKDQEVDHKNLNGLDNQKHNLRFCVHSEQMRNRGRIKSSGFKGVYLQRKSPRRPFYVKITKDREGFYGGSFSDEIEAAKKYDSMAVELFGEFAATNAKLGLL